MKIQDKHFLTIKQIYPDTISVTKPVTAGLAHDVYITETKNNKYICRFSTKTVAMHNLQISNLLTSNNIPVPKITVHEFKDYCCETYPFISGKTLHECILEGLSTDKLDNVYKQLFDMSYKISNIPCNNILPASTTLASNVLRKLIAFVNPSEQKLCHIDLHAKNILLNEQYDICAILDLDAFIQENIFVSYFIMMRDAKTYGYNINRLNDIFERMGIQFLNTKIQTLNFAVRAYHLVLPECIRKQILKIRTK